MLNLYYYPGRHASHSEKVVWPTALFLNSKHLFVQHLYRLADRATCHNVLFILYIMYLLYIISYDIYIYIN